MTRSSGCATSSAALARAGGKTMIPTSLSELGALAIGGVSITMLLTKATIILVVALGITLSMQRASAVARHLVWLVTLGALLLVPALSAWAPLRLAILPETLAAKKAPAITSVGTERKTESSVGLAGGAHATAS